MPEIPASRRAMGARLFAVSDHTPAPASDRYGPPGTTDSPQYVDGKPTGLQAGSDGKKKGDD